MHQIRSMNNYEELVNPTHESNLWGVGYGGYRGEEGEVRDSGSGSARAFGDDGFGVRPRMGTPSTVMESENPFDDVYSGRATRGGVSDDDEGHGNFGERRGGDGDDGSRMGHVDDDTTAVALCGLRAKSTSWKYFL